jgi:hypothetical protein
MVLFATSSGLTPKTLGPIRDIVSISIAAAATFLLSALFCRWDGISLGDVGAALTARSLPRFSIGFAVGAAMISADVAMLRLSGQMHWQRVPLHGLGDVASSFTLFLPVALREELAFRGYPLRRLDAAFGAWPAQLIVAVIFALEHLGAGYSWSNALFGSFAGALLFGMAALLSRGLAVPVGIHLAWNLGDWMIGNKAAPGLWQIVAPTTQLIGLSAYLFAVVVAVILLVLLRKWIIAPVS